MNEAIIKLRDGLKETLNLASKKKYIIEFLKTGKKVNIRKTTSAIHSLTDKMLLLNLYEHATTGHGPLDFLNIFILKNKINLMINHEARAILSVLESKERTGKTFEDLIYEQLIPHSRKNEYLILADVNNSLQYSGNSFFTLNKKIIQTVVKSLHQIREMKNQPITGDSLKIYLENRNFKDHAFQNVFLKFIKDDPFFLKYYKSIEAHLHTLEPEKKTAVKKSGKKNMGKLRFNELKKVTDLGHFADISEKLVDSCRDYIDEIIILFQLLLNDPLINIYKLLRFPSNREFFRQWIKDSPVPMKESGAIEKKIESIKTGVMQRYEEYNPPETEVDLFTIFYDLNIDSTLKYKLIYNSPMGKDTDGNLKKLCLHLIKTVQYNTEKAFLKKEVEIINKSATSNKALLGLGLSKTELDKKIDQYKRKFNTHLLLVCKNMAPTGIKFFKSLDKQVTSEKLIPPEMILKAWSLLKGQKNFESVLKMSNYLINFYITLNCRLINDFLTTFIKTLDLSDGIFVRKLLSSETKEKIFEFCRKYEKEKEFLKEKLNEYFNQGDRELFIRDNLLKDLAATNEERQYVKAGKYSVSVKKDGTSYTVIVKDSSGNIKYCKEAALINNFFDFISHIKQNKIKSLENISDRQWKILYQNSFVEYVKDLKEYIGEKLELLSIPCCLTSITSRDLKAGLKTCENKEKYLAPFVKSGEKEKIMRSDLLRKLGRELKSGEKAMDHKVLTRVLDEITVQKEKTAKIETMLGFINKVIEKETVTVETEKHTTSNKPSKPEKKPAYDFPAESFDFPDLTIEEEKKDIPMVDLENLEETIEEVRVPNVEISFLNKSAEDNQNMIDRVKEALEKKLKEELDVYVQKEMTSLQEYISNFPEVTVLSLPDSVLGPHGSKPAVVFNNFMQGIRDMPDNKKVAAMRGYIKKAEEEIKKREAYITDREKNVEIGISILIYGKETEMQKDLVGRIKKTVSIFYYELTRYE